MSSLDIYWARHGQTGKNLTPEYICGRSGDEPLTQIGEAEATELGIALRHTDIAPDVIFSSPALRARETARLALGAWGISMPVTIDDRLQELNMGEWEGRLRTEIYTDEQVAIIMADQHNFAPPGGESIADLQSRVANFYGGVLLDRNARPQEPTVVVVFAHEFVVKGAVGSINGWSVDEMRALRLGNCSLTQTSHQDEQWSVPLLGVMPAELGK